jgi:hypothetical protein
MFLSILQERQPRLICNKNGPSFPLPLFTEVWKGILRFNLKVINYLNDHTPLIFKDKYINIQRFVWTLNLTFPNKLRLKKFHTSHSYTCLFVSLIIG